jgi:hypothetical protein
MEKYIRKIDGENYVGVVISTDFGAGWSTWNLVNPCDGNFIKFLLEVGEIDKSNDFSWQVEIPVEMVEAYYNDDQIYYGGIDGGLRIEWIKEGTIIRINEYDGSESIETLEEAGFFEV